MAPTLLCDDLDDCLDRDAELAGAETVGTDALDGIAMREVVRGGVNFKAFRKTPYHPYAQEEVVDQRAVSMLRVGSHESAYGFPSSTLRSFRKIRVRGSRKTAPPRPTWPSTASCERTEKLHP